MASTEFNCQISPLPELASLEARWRELEARSDCSVFLSWNWMSVWLSLSEGSFHLVEFFAGESLVGLALLGQGLVKKGPFQFQSLFLNQSGDEEEDRVFIEYNDVLAAPSDKAAIWEALFERLRVEPATLPKPLQCWSQMRLAGMVSAPDNQIMQSGLIDLQRQTQKCYLIDLDQLRSENQTFEQSLSANSRQKVNRSYRLLQNFGEIEIQFAKSQQDAVDWLPEMVEMQTNWFATKDKGAALSRPFFLKFIEQLLLHGLTSGIVDFIQVRSGERSIGYLINLKWKDHVLAYQSAFSIFDDNKIKPGLVCHGRLIEHYIQDGARSYNLLAGDSQYKTSLSNVTESLEWLTLARPNAKMRLFKLASDWLGR